MKIRKTIKLSEIEKIQCSEIITPLIHLTTHAVKKFLHEIFVHNQIERAESTLRGEQQER